MDKFILLVKHEEGDEYSVRHKIKGKADLTLLAKALSVSMDNLAKGQKYSSKDLKEMLLFLYMDEAGLSEAAHLTGDYLHKRVKEWSGESVKKSSNCFSRFWKKVKSKIG